MRAPSDLPHIDVIRIEDPLDARLDPYRDIKEKDLVGRQQRFVAEGKVVLNVLFASNRFEAESLLILENRLAGLQEQLLACPPDVPVYCVPSTVMDAVAGFHVHRGILAIGRRKNVLSLNQMINSLPAEALVVVLCGLSNHDNVGSIFRNAAAFEADCILMDAGSCDPLYRKAIRVSVGATLKVPYCHEGSIGEILTALDQAQFKTLALSPSGQASIYQSEAVARRALLLGTEGDGLPAELLSRLETARIPMSQSFDSLNVATASGIALSHFSRFA